MIKIKIKGDFTNQLEARVDQEKKRVMEELKNDLVLATPVDTGEAQKGWVIEGDSIVNHVDHIGVLNTGSSKQAPSHFIEKTLLAHEGISPSGTIVRSE